MLAALQIIGSGNSFAILHGNRVLARATSNDNALARISGVERELRLRPRRCLCCQVEFASLGANNRMCNTCRRTA